MGVLTLQQFQDELSDMLAIAGAGRKLGTERLTRYLNMGQQELANSVEFESLVASDIISTVKDDKDYTLDTSIDQVRQVIDVTNETILSRVPYEEYLRHDRTDTGQPEIWARAGGLLYLWPVPDAVYSIEVWFQSVPTALAAAIDTTQFLGVWDQAVLLLAGKVGASLNNLPEKAQIFLQEARLYIGSRTADAAADRVSQNMGIQVAWDRSDLINQRTGSP